MSNTISISPDSVIARINCSKMPPLAKEHKISIVNKNTDRNEVLLEMLEFCNTFDKDYEANLRKREAQSFNTKTDNWEAPAPDMTKSHMSAEDKRKEAREAAKANLLARRQARKQMAINKKLEFGIGLHEVVVVDGNFSSNNDEWMWIKIQDVSSNFTSTFSWYVGPDSENKCVSDKLVKYMRSEDETIPTIDECGDELDWIETMITTKKHFFVKSSISKYDPTKLYHMFNHFDDELDEEASDDKPEEVEYNDAIDSRVKKNYAPRPTEDLSLQGLVNAICDDSPEAVADAY